MGHVIGLDIGSFAVRAVEVSLDERPTLAAVGQVALPPGAVVDGEVVDAAVVTDAIRKLWARGRFSTKQVRLGVSSQRVIVRQAELPAMSEDELRSAIHFEAQELIPIPIDEALLDFCMLGDDPTPADDDGGEARMKVLLVAAPRDMVMEHLATVEAAGLLVDAVDVVPLALFRAVPSFGPSAGGSEAIVSIGAALTTVVVRERGVPRFMRVLKRGTDDVTAALAQGLSVDHDAAEDVKRRSAQAGGTATAVRARAMIADGVAPLVAEIRGSLDFWLAQAEAERIDRIVLAGGGVHTDGLGAALAHAIGHEVEIADPLIWLKLGKTGLSEDELRKAGPLMVTPLGLALGGSSGPLRGLHISLMPPEVLRARKQKKQIVSGAMAAAAVAAVLGLVWAWQSNRVAGAEHAANRAEAQAGVLAARVAAANSVSGAKVELRARQTLTVTVLQTDIDWTRLLEQMTAQLPADVYLTSFAGTSAGGGSATGATGGIGATVSISAVGSNPQSVSEWLVQESAIPALTNLWVPSASKVTAGSGTVSFSSTANLTDGAYSDRAAKVGK